MITTDVIKYLVIPIIYKSRDIFARVQTVLQDLSVLKPGNNANVNLVKVTILTYFSDVIIH